jgi:hypothetical protein
MKTPAEQLLQEGLSLAGIGCPELDLRNHWFHFFMPSE